MRNEGYQKIMDALNAANISSTLSVGDKDEGQAMRFIEIVHNERHAPILNALSRACLMVDSAEDAETAQFPKLRVVEACYGTQRDYEASILLEDTNLDSI